MGVDAARNSNRAMRFVGEESKEGVRALFVLSREGGGVVAWLEMIKKHPP